MNQFDIFISFISWGNSGKNRPVLVFKINNKIVDVYLITTQYSGKRKQIQSRYFKIIDWKQAGLDKQSYIDTGIMVPVPMSVLKNKTVIGMLTEADKKRLLKFLNN